MTAFRHCCVGESRIDPWASEIARGFTPLTEWEDANDRL
jgi:hypothetical protein